MKRMVLFIAVICLYTGANMVFAGGAQEAGSEIAGTGVDLDDFPDSYPIPSPVDPSEYAYDDMSMKYDFEMMTYGYTILPMPDNPITDYLNEQLNVDITFTDVPGGDLTNAVAVRFASGDPPDFAHLADKNAVLTLFDQGQLLDVSGLLKYVPQASQYITKTAAKWATVENQMIGIPRYQIFQNNWGLYVRKDWLDKFGMDMPETEDDLYAFAKAVAFDDPDGNGKDDTWFMGAAGSGTSFQMLEEFRSMYGHPSWNVSNGKINHPMLDGTTKDFLMFLNKLNKDKILLPDWYTIDWNNFSAYSFNDQIGMVFYPGWNLMREYYDAQGQDLERLKVWSAIDPPSSNDGRGGLYRPGRGPRGFQVIPTDVGKDLGRLKRILHVYDTLVYPNVNYWASSTGGGPEIFPDGSRVVFNPEDGTNIYERFRDIHPAYVDPNRNPLQNWQTFGYTLLWEIFDDPMGIIGGRWNLYVNAMPRYDNFDIHITLDGETDAKIKEFQQTNEIAFVLGDRSFDEWGEYLDEWKKAGGQKLMDQAAEQLEVSSQ